MSDMYSPLVYPILNEGGSYTRPDLPETFISLAFETQSWDLASSNDLDRTEYWLDTAGALTLGQACLLSTSNVSAEYNKSRVLTLLSATDWVELPSVTDITNTPHLTNPADFISYRNTLRGFVIAPVAGNVALPVKPMELWA